MKQFLRFIGAISGILGCVCAGYWILFLVGFGFRYVTQTLDFSDGRDQWMMTPLLGLLIFFSGGVLCLVLVYGLINLWRNCAD
jgi:hypothetical protein